MSSYIIEGIKFTTSTENEIESEALSLKSGGEIIELDLKIVFKNDTSPNVFKINWEEAQVDMIGIFTAKDWFTKHITPDWSKRCADSRLASGMPLLSVYSKSDENRMTVSLSDPKSPTSILAGVVEETGEISFEIDLFSQKCSKMKEYQITIRIDRRTVPFYQAIKDTKLWWEGIGYATPYIDRKSVV